MTMLWVDFMRYKLQFSCVHSTPSKRNTRELDQSASFFLWRCRRKKSEASPLLERLRSRLKLNEFGFSWAYNEKFWKLHGGWIIFRSRRWEIIEIYSFPAYMLESACIVQAAETIHQKGLNFTGLLNFVSLQCAIWWSSKNFESEEFLLSWLEH